MGRDLVGHDSKVTCYHRRGHRNEITVATWHVMTCSWLCTTDVCATLNIPDFCICALIIYMEGKPNKSELPVSKSMHPVLTYMKCYSQQKRDIIIIIFIVNLCFISISLQTADLAAAPLAVTMTREKYVDFLVPFQR